MRATNAKKRKPRTLAEIKRRRRRRRIMQVYCARILFLVITIIIISLIAFITSMFKSYSKEKVIESSYSNTTIGAVPVEIPITQKSIFNVEEIEEVSIDSEETIIRSTNKTEIFASAKPSPEPRISAYEPGEVYYYQFSYEEKLYIAKVVYAESRGECFEGQVAVAAVVINRYFSDDPYFDNDTIQSVIMQKNQFASIDDVTEEKLNNSSCMEAVEAACKGYDPTRKLFDEGAKYFFDPEGITSEYQLRIRTGIEELIIGNHHFHNEFNEEEVRKGR